jgi:acetoacetate decarboxylase
MKIADVRAKAFAMPLTSPSYPLGPYRFYNREYVIVTYRTDMEALRAVVPEPLEIAEPHVKYEFIRMPDSTGFGDYTESGQVIPVRFKGEDGVFVHSMYLDDDSPISGGREIWGFPKKLANPKISHEGEFWSARCIAARCSAPPPPWDTSTRSSRRSPFSPRCDSRIF